MADATLEKTETSAVSGHGQSCRRVLSWLAALAAMAWMAGAMAEQPEPAPAAPLVPDTVILDPVIPDPVILGDTLCPWAVPVGESVRCHTLHVRETRGDPESPMIRLFVAVTRSLSETPAPDPVLIVAGGPGQAASAEVPRRWYRFLSLRARRDIIFVDQRGTGQGWPPLTCPGLVVTRTPEREGLERCLAALEASGVDPSAYNTTASALDLRDLRLALGIDRWNLIGTSYGTGLALELMRRDPIGVRSAVLNSPRAPHQFFASTAFAANRQRVFEMFFTDCAADPVCAAAYPDLEAQFLELRDLLAETPVRLGDLQPAATDYYGSSGDDDGDGRDGQADGNASPGDAADDPADGPADAGEPRATGDEAGETGAVDPAPPIPEPVLYPQPRSESDPAPEPAPESAPESAPDPSSEPPSELASERAPDPERAPEPLPEPGRQRPSETETEPETQTDPQSDDEAEPPAAAAGEIRLGFADLVDGLSERIGVSDAAGSAPNHIARLHAGLRDGAELSDEQVRAAFGNAVLRRSLDGFAYALNVSVLCREEYPFVDYEALNGELAAFAPYVDPGADRRCLPHRLSVLGGRPRRRRVPRSGRRRCPGLGVKRDLRPLYAAGLGQRGGGRLAPGNPGDVPRNRPRRPGQRTLRPVRCRSVCHGS